MMGFSLGGGGGGGGGRALPLCRGKERPPCPGKR